VGFERGLNPRGVRHLLPKTAAKKTAGAGVRPNTAARAPSASLWKPTLPLAASAFRFVPILLI